MTGALNIARRGCGDTFQRSRPGDGCHICVGVVRLVRSMRFHWQANQISRTMTAIWQKSFSEFAGPGIHHPSDAMRVSEQEAATIIADLAGRTWWMPVMSGAGRHRGYSVCHARDGYVTALFGAEGIVGFYAGSYLWIARQHRGRGLSTPLILAAAEHRGGTVLPPGVVFQGYSAPGLAAHRAAHRYAMGAAIAAGLRWPLKLLAGLQLGGSQGFIQPPSTCS